MDILIVTATLLTGLGLANLLAAWVDRRVSLVALVFIGVGIALFVWAHMTLPEGLTIWDVPDSFILVAARILN